MPTNDMATAAEKTPQVAAGATPWTDLGLRISFVLLAAGAGAFGAPWPLATPLVAVAGLVTVERWVRRRRRGWLDAVAVGGGSVLVVIILVGFLLNLLPGGLTRRSWAGALALVGIVVLLRCRAEAPRETPALISSRRPRPVNALLYVLTGGLVVFALVVSVLSTGSDRTPDFHLAVQQQQISATSPWVPVVVSSSAGYGPLQLLLDEGHGPHVWGELFEVTADRPRTVVVPVPVGARVTVSLTEAGDPTPLRRVTIDRSDPLASGGARADAP
ncbi:MAG: hypothetical protein P8Z68_03485 [Kineosporiaceae bacterium]